MDVHLPNTNMFFPDGNLELERVETSLRIEVLKGITIKLVFLLVIT
jgi:hypothetical protein